MTSENEEKIRARAHQIWEREGRPEGRDEEHWAQAVREIANEDAAGGDLSDGLKVTAADDPIGGRAERAAGASSAGRRG